MKELKVFCTENMLHYASTLNRHFNVQISDNYKDADLIIFTGGEDVSPSWYDEEKHPRTYSSFKRDLREVEVFNYAKKNKIKMLGICRGSQFLTVMNGGKLIQDVNNHAFIGKHAIWAAGKIISITSTHHQMMYPYNLDPDEYELIGYSEPNRSTYYSTGSNMYDSLKDIPRHKDTFILDIGKEPEIVYYTRTNSLCIQGHPESMLDDLDSIDHINNIIKSTIFRHDSRIFA